MDGQAGNGLAQVRASDAEREAVVARLNAATGEGRLSLEEFSERVTVALAARTQGDLDLVVQDLPGGSGSPRAVSAVSAPAQNVRSRTSVFGSVKRSGRWRMDRDAKIATIMGSVKLDLRDAEFPAAAVQLKVESVFGSVKVWIPRGVAVEVEGESLFGSRKVEEDVAGVEAPLLQLRVSTVFGSVKVYRV
jgi:hypothetical protein